MKSKSPKSSRTLTMSSNIPAERNRASKVQHQLEQKVSLVLNNQEKLSTNYVGPSVAIFPDVLPNKRTKFMLYSRFKAPDQKDSGNGSVKSINNQVSNILVGETSKLEFKSSINPSVRINQTINDNQQKNCNYLLGIFRPSTQQLEVFPTTQFYEMRPIVKRLKRLKKNQNQVEDEEDDTKDEEVGEGDNGYEDYKSSRIELGNTFGSLKTKRSIQAADRNRINPELMNHLEDHLTSSIAKNSISIPTSRYGDKSNAEGVVTDSDIPNYLPKLNREARRADLVYRLPDLVSLKELNSINLDGLLINDDEDDEEAGRICFLNSFSKLLPFPQSKFVSPRIRLLWFSSSSSIRRIIRSRKDRDLKRFRPKPRDDGNGEDEGSNKRIIDAEEEDQRTIRNLKVLIYLNYLINVKRNVKAKSNFQTSYLTYKSILYQISSKIDKNNEEENSKHLNPIIHGILNRFTESTQQQSNQQQQQKLQHQSGSTDSKTIGTRNLITNFCMTKLLCHIAILGLIVDDFTSDFGELAEDLKEPTNRIKEIFKSVGCHVANPTMIKKLKPTNLNEENVNDEQRSGLTSNILLKRTIDQVEIDIKPEGDDTDGVQREDQGVKLEFVRAGCIAKLVLPLKFVEPVKHKRSRGR